METKARLLRCLWLLFILASIEVQAFTNHCRTHGSVLNGQNILPKFSSRPVATLLNVASEINEEPRNKFQPEEETVGGFIPGSLLVYSPAVLALGAFFSYKDTSRAFHGFVEFASQNTWESVDGGVYLTDLITPALTGPVAGFISLLFGTLTSMTMSSLYNRQAEISSNLSELLEDIRLAELHFSYFPPTYKQKAIRLVDDYAISLLNIVVAETPAEVFLKEKREVGRSILEKLMELLHDMSHDPNADVNERVLDEAYGTVNRLFRCRSKIISVFENQFPRWHYANLSVLAAAICTIFLVLTDKTALLFLGGFQLRMCWSMLIGTFSILAVVIYDLNTPLSGTFQVLKPIKMAGLKEYINRVDSRDQEEGSSKA